MNNINPCPFCGGKSRVHKYLGKWYARCNKCKTYSAPYDTEEQAAEAWNRRAGEPCDLCRHGRWEVNGDRFYPFCSNCKYEPPKEQIRSNALSLEPILTKYCPNKEALEGAMIGVENALLYQIKKLKSCVKSDNSDYLKGYLCALSAVEGIIEEGKRVNND